MTLGHPSKIIVEESGREERSIRQPCQHQVHRLSSSSERIPPFSGEDVTRPFSPPGNERPYVNLPVRLGAEKLSDVSDVTTLLAMDGYVVRRRLPDRLTSFTATAVRLQSQTGQVTMVPPRRTARGGRGRCQGTPAGIVDFGYPLAVGILTWTRHHDRRVQAHSTCRHLSASGHVQ